MVECGVAIGDLTCTDNALKPASHDEPLQRAGNFRIKVQ